MIRRVESQATIVFGYARLACVGAMLTTVLAFPALAQTSVGLAGTRPSLQPLSARTALAANSGATNKTLSAPTPGAPGTAVAVVPAVQAPDLSRFSRFDRYRVKGNNIPFPGAEDTIDQGLLGVRDALASAGFGYFGYSTFLFQDNVLRHGLPAGNARSNQTYVGQLPTYLNANFLFLTYDTSRWGVPDGQIVAGLNYYSTNWNPAGPKGFTLAQLSWYQTLFNKKVEVEFGYLGNQLNYIGTYVNGSLAGGVLGPNASVASEVGLSRTSNAAPGFDVTVHLPQNFYTKFGIQRALNPDGVVVEHNENRSAANFTTSNSGALYVGELGYKVAPAPGIMSTWVRADAVANSSNYRQINSRLGTTTTRSEGDYALSLLVDRQIVQLSKNPRSAARGIYVGASAFFTPPGYNAVSKVFEGRIFGVGLIPSRPRDLASVVYDSTSFSGYLVHAAQNAGRLAHDGSNTITGSYSANITHGVYLNLGLAYVDHPTPVTYTGSTGSALNVIAGVVFFL